MLALTVAAERVGNTVTLTFLGAQAVATTAAIITSAANTLPAEFCPVGYTVLNPLIVDNSGGITMGNISIQANGAISIQTMAGNFAASGVVGFNKCSTSYSTVSL